MLCWLSYQQSKTGAEKYLIVPDEINTVEVARQAKPAIVQINSKTKPEYLLTGDDPIEVGTGFFYKNNLIVTAYHTVQRAENITITLHNGRTVPAEIEAVDPGIDIALLKTTTNAPRILNFGNSTALLAGQKIIVIGSPFKIQNFISTGVFSVMTEATQVPRSDNLANEVGKYLMTTAGIQGGNSGGPLLNSKGLVVGIADANAAANSLVPGVIGIAIPGDLVKQSLEDLEKTGAPQRGNLGVTLLSLEELDPALLQLAGLINNQGVLVDEIIAGSPAGRAGLRGSLRNERGQLLAPLGDIIIAIDNQPVSKPFDVTSLMLDKRPGQKVKLTVWRNNERHTIEVVLQNRSPGEFGLP